MELSNLRKYRTEPKHFRVRSSTTHMSILASCRLGFCSVQTLPAGADMRNSTQVCSALYMKKKIHIFAKSSKSICIGVTRKANLATLLLIHRETLPDICDKEMRGLWWSSCKTSGSSAVQVLFHAVSYCALCVCLIFK